MKKVEKIHTTAICRGHDPFSALLSFWQRSAIWCAKPSSSSTNVFSLSLVASTISLVNICFHASMYREVDPRCAEESSTLTCPYVSNVIPSWKFSFVRGSERGIPGAFFARAKDFVWVLLFIRRPRFYSEITQTDHEVCFKSRSKELFVNIGLRVYENIESFLFHNMEKLMLRLSSGFIDPYLFFVQLIINDRNRASSSNFVSFV